MNQINIIGRIGKEIEMKFLPSGIALANFSIAVNQDYKKDDVKVEKTSWFDVTVFGKQAETVHKFFSKGSMIGITGELEQQIWKTQEGANRSKVIIKLQSFTFIDKKADNPQQQQQQPRQEVYSPRQQPQQQEVTYDIIDEEIPF